MWSFHSEMNRSNPTSVPSLVAFRFWGDRSENSVRTVFRQWLSSGSVLTCGNRSGNQFCVGSPKFSLRRNSHFGFERRCRTALFRSTTRIESCDAVIRVYDEAGNVIETHEHRAISKNGSSLLSRAGRAPLGIKYGIDMEDTHWRLAALLIALVVTGCLTGGASMNSSYWTRPGHATVHRPSAGRRRKPQAFVGAGERHCHRSASPGSRGSVADSFGALWPR
jgi:hypothetical protein